MPCGGRDRFGQHCCQFDGADCQWLAYVDGLPRCSRFGEWGRLKDDPVWQAAPVGRWFAVNHPGFECQDWPQNVDVPVGGRCCWEV